MFFIFRQLVDRRTLDVSRNRNEIAYGRYKDHVAVAQPRVALTAAMQQKLVNIERGNFLIAAFYLYRAHRAGRRRASCLR